MRTMGQSATLIAFLACAACGSGSEGAATGDASAPGTGGGSSGNHGSGNQSPSSDGGESATSGNTTGGSGAPTGPLSDGGATLPGFLNPPVEARLKTRLGAIPGAGIDADLQELAKSGFGAAEIGVLADSSAQASLTSTLNSAKAAGIMIDLAPGGGQPYSVPGLTEATSMQQLTPVPSAVITSDGTMSYSQMPPSPAYSKLATSPTLKLVAVTAARVTDSSGATTLLDPDSAIDLDPNVNSSGLVQWTVPKGNWVVFGFWQRATGQTANGYPPFQMPDAWSAKVPSQGAGGYFLADIFSGVGVGAALDNLASTVLNSTNLALLQGTQFAHDSLEVQAEMFWTSNLPTEFNTRRGYSMFKYLPALHTPKEASFDPLTKNWGVTPPLVPEYDFINGVGDRVRYDYHRTLTDLYIDEYLKTFMDRLHKYGMSFRAQVAYNYLPLNMTRSGAAVDIPENESFDSGWPVPLDPTVPAYGTDRWRRAMDCYRLTGSGAHLNKGKRATFEFGDDFAIYHKQPVDYAQQLNEGFAGGITMGLLTGFAGIGSGWPTPAGLASLGIGDTWTTAWPQWRDWSSLTDYFARSNIVLETGKPQIDVVIYHDKGVSNVHELTTPKFASSSLESAGFTYDFVDPVSLTSASATSVNGVLFGKGPSYRALLVNNETSIPADAAQTILTAAKSGLAVVVVGNPPSQSTGLLNAAAQDAIVVQAMKDLVQLSNVAQVMSADMAASALLKLGKSPAASFGGSSSLLSVHRVTDQGDDVWWVFNPTDKDSSVTASFATTGAPYGLDLWSGAAGRVAQWSQSGGRVLVPLVLPAHATTAFLFPHETAALHVTSTTVEGALYDGDNLLVRDSHGGKMNVTLSDGSTQMVDLGTVPPPIQVASWSLAVDEISPSGHTAHTVALTALKDWRDIPELKDAVGTATYSATVNVPASLLSAGSDVLLDVGGMAGAMQLSVNGTLVTKQTTPGGRWSVGKLLKAGDNAVSVRLDTALINRMAQLSSANTAGYTSQTPLSPTPSGLLGPVQLIPVALKNVGRIR
jgi:hypothetical protein